MANTIATPLRLTQDVYSNKGFADAMSLTEARQYNPQFIDQMVTHLFYSSKNWSAKNNPLTFLSKGKGNIKNITTPDGSYNAMIIGKPQKISTIAFNPYIAGDKPGIGASQFELYFNDDFFYAGQSIYTGLSRIEVRIMYPLVKTLNGFKAVCQLMSGDQNMFVPVTEIGLGSRFSGGVRKVGLSASLGGESRSYHPSTMTNQVNLIRESYNWKGNVANKALKFEVMIDGKIQKYFCEYELAQHMSSFNEKLEMDLWHSVYNKDNGSVGIFDVDGGAPIYSGAGLLQQITNEDSFSFLTENKIKAVLDTIYYNATDDEYGDGVSTTIFTGRGGMEDFDKAMKQSLTSQGFTIADSTLQSTGKSNDVNKMYGSYFTSYKNIDNRTVNVVHLPFLDKSAFAEASPKHPITGRPLVSHDMYIVDTSNIEGSSNLVYTQEQMSPMTWKYFKGMNDAPGSLGLNDNSQMISTTKDSSSIEYKCSQGIWLRKPTNCIKLYCRF